MSHYILTKIVVKTTWLNAEQNMKIMVDCSDGHTQDQAVASQSGCSLWSYPGPKGRLTEQMHLCTNGQTDKKITTKQQSRWVQNV